MATSTSLFPQTPDNLVRDQAGNSYKMYCGVKTLTPGSSDTSVMVFTTDQQKSTFGRAFDRSRGDQFFCANTNFSANANEVVPVVESSAMWARECNNSLLKSAITISYMVLIRQ